jgi:uncharacterized membrane protein
LTALQEHRSVPPISRQHQTTRLETFVDAAFAFALTMLVISVDSIPQSFDELMNALKGVPAFAASFAITVAFWHGHYRWSRRFGLEDGWSVVLSLVLVFLMLSGALNSISGGWLPSELEITTLSHVRSFFVLYGLAFALMSGVLLALNAHVLRLETTPPLGFTERLAARIEIEVWAILAAMGAISALLATLLPPRLVSVSVWLYAALMVIMPLMSRRWRRIGTLADTLERDGAS